MKKLNQYEMEQVAGGGWKDDLKNLWDETRKDAKDVGKEVGKGFSEAGSILGDAFKKAWNVMHHN